MSEAARLSPKTQKILEELSPAISELAVQAAVAATQEVLKQIQVPTVAHGWAVQKALFSKRECTRLSQLMTDLLDAEGHDAVVRVSEVDKSIRVSRTAWLAPYGNFFDGTAAELVQSAFIRMVGFGHVVSGSTIQSLPQRLAAFPAEKVQVTRYLPQGFYGSHRDDDSGNKHNRVLSMGVTLRQPTKGGRFRFRDVTLDEEMDAIVHTPGSAIAFPSSAYHEVTPVEEGGGERLSLVLWMSGVGE